MKKEKEMIYEMKKEKIQDEEDILIYEGWWACMDFMKNKMMSRAEIDINEIKDSSLEFVCWSLVNRFFDFILDACYDELIRLMDQTISCYEMEEAEVEDIPDPEWMSCEKDCKHCNKECSYRKVDSICPGECMICDEVCLNRKEEYEDDLEDSLDEDELADALDDPDAFLDKALKEDE